MEGAGIGVGLQEGEGRKGLPWWWELPALPGLLLRAGAAIPSSILPRLVEQFEPLGLQVLRSCMQSDVITGSHQFV